MQRPVRMVFKLPKQTARSKPSPQKEFVPPEHRMQVGSLKFRFDLIYKSKHFQKLIANAFRQDLIRDVCDESLSDLSEQELFELALDRYIEIVQKSKTWFDARKKASGTGSVVGKNCNLPRVKYPTAEQCEQAWVDLQNKKPFEKTHTMRGHMKWGVGYEDPALVHFTEKTGLGVVQVGTIHLPMNVVYKKADQLFDDFPAWDSTDDYLLVSPDGVVGIPEPSSCETTDESGKSNRFRKMYQTVVGMLEIKCISPFHHIETDDGFLTWVDSMMRRQWTDRTKIPLVYIVQMSLQALAGHHRLNLGDGAGMWFLRWSPENYVIYKFSFLRLFQLGCWVIRWYHSTYLRRIKTQSNTASGLTDLEQLCRKQAQVCYDLLLKEADYTFTELDCYPEFSMYRDVTRFFKFKVEESDQVEFGLGHSLPTEKTPVPVQDTAPLAPKPIKRRRFMGLKQGHAVPQTPLIGSKNPATQKPVKNTKGRLMGLKVRSSSDDGTFRRKRRGFMGLKKR